MLSLWRSRTQMYLFKSLQPYQWKTVKYWWSRCCYYWKPHKDSWLRCRRGQTLVSSETDRWTNFSTRSQHHKHAQLIWNTKITLWVHLDLPFVFHSLRIEYSHLETRRTAALSVYYWVGAVLRRICSRTFSFRLRPSPSVPVRSPPFYYVLPYYSVLLRPLLCFRFIRPILSAFHIRIRPVFSEFRPRFILLPLLFGYNPYQPNPIAPRSLIYFCSLLSYDPCILIVPICINYDKL